ncbi:MAG: hypothetical protein ACKVU2_11545 [Saprospiraceae bacterium]
MWTLLEGFDHLTTDEMDTLLSTPVWITVLVGGADGEIDREERTWAERLMHMRSYSLPEPLNEYYRVVSENFLEKLDFAMDTLPKEQEPRNAALVQKIAMANAVLAKLDGPIAAILYQSYRTLAEETAKASGGFLRIGAVSASEKQWISLFMLTPVSAEGANLYKPWEEPNGEESEEKR